MRSKLAMALLLIGVWPCAAALGQAPAQGKLVVATADIGDPSWAETVVLVLHHDANGSLGIAINRPTWVEPDALVPALGELEGYSGGVFRGGPLAPTQMIFLVREPPPGLLDAPPILDGVHAGGDLRLFRRLVDELGNRRLRLYAGHVEWMAGQLQREIADGRWTVVDGSADLVFSAEPEQLWQRLLRAAGELLVEAHPERLIR